MRRIGFVLVACAAVAGCQSAAGGRGSDEALRPGLATEEVKGMFSASNRRRALEAEYQALQFGPIGAPVEWIGGGDRRGSVIPGPTYRIGSRDCRDYTHTFYIGDAATVRKGTACRKGDGDWELTT